MSDYCIPIETVTLKTPKIGASITVSAQVLRDLPPDARLRCYEDAIGNLRFEMERRLLGEKLDTQTHRTPATFLDAVKHFKVLPTWILRRMKPVRYVETTMEAWAYYPKVSLPREESIVKIIKNGGF